MIVIADFFGVVLGVWFWVGVFSSPYFWFKRTNRSQSPIQRRLVAFGYGLAWPYLLMKHLTGKEQARAAEAERTAAESRILGTGPALPMPPVGQARPAIRNPFDN